MITIVRDPIDHDAVLRAVSSHQAGAVLLFLGTTRQFTGEKETTALDYDCYEEMALKQMTRLAEQAKEKWQLQGVAMMHRVGHPELGEASVAIAVSSAHREAAFDAGKWLIDTLKEVVPIWKKENWSDGTTEWVHHGC